MSSLKKVYYIDKKDNKHKFKYFESHTDANKWIADNKDTVFVRLKKGVCNDIRK